MSTRTQDFEDDLIEGSFHLDGVRIRIASKDFNAASDFYSTTFDFRVLNEAGTVVRPQPNGRNTIILVIDEVLGDPERLRRLPYRSQVCEFVVDDFDERILEYQVAGCHFDLDPFRSNIPVRFTQFEDPFGHYWSLLRSKVIVPK
jgi:uncharacterized glyoxalase superfamily protein PhnB